MSIILIWKKRFEIIYNWSSSTRIKNNRKSFDEVRTYGHKNRGKMIDETYKKEIIN